MSQAQDATDRRIVATYLLDLLDSVADELAHWLATGERVACPRCAQLVPARNAGGVPVRHRLDRVGEPGVWCVE